MTEKQIKLRHPGLDREHTVRTEHVARLYEQRGWERVGASEETSEPAGKKPGRQGAA